jgi:DNA polymerase III sliding clamp (beta) subunit (PCNA family)
MKINRERLLSDLELVKAGLSPREILEQSSCFCFQDGLVMTFNDEVSCRKETELNIVGAVQAASLLAILDKVEEPDLDVRENEDGELEFKGDGKTFAIIKDAQIFLPVDRVEMPEKWHPLPKELIEAIGLVKHCVSTDESRFLLTCVHIGPEFVESCDNQQVMRVTIKTGLKKDVLVRGTSIAHITSLAMDEIAMTQNWLHFRNQNGLIFSCRRYTEDYPSMDSVLNFKGTAITIPKGLAATCTRAAIFASSDGAADPAVRVSLMKGKVRILGEGLTGWYKEIKSIAYDGEPLDFFIAPDLLKHIAEKYSDAEVSEERLKVQGGSWKYVTALKKKVEAEEKTE